MSGAVSAFDAKNRLGQLLDRVESGERITITRHGDPVAMLVPIPGKRNEGVARAVQTITAIRATLQKRGVRLSAKEIREMISEGRR
ncbi:MAG: type II toxin-antitoxin system prevent-host-death family antitoxin [Tepidisphaeraceae bacterium]